MSYFSRSSEEKDPSATRGDIEAITAELDKSTSNILIAAVEAGVGMRMIAGGAKLTAADTDARNIAGVLHAHGGYDMTTT